MALIKCPECGKEISDKAPACIHCGFPLSLFHGGETLTKIDDTSTKNKLSVISDKGTQELYSLEIIDSNGSNVKIITILKKYFGYSLDDAKQTVSVLPIFVEASFDVKSIGCIAQELLDAGVDYKIYKGNKEILFDLDTTDKVVKSVLENFVTDTKAVIKQCPQCGQITNQPDAFYCLKCNVRYERIKNNHQENYYEEQEKNTPKCPTCGSTNIQKISGTKRWITTGLFGLASSNVGKTMECKNCGYKW